MTIIDARIELPDSVGDKTTALEKLKQAVESLGGVMFGTTLSEEELEKEEREEKRFDDFLKVIEDEGVENEEC